MAAKGSALGDLSPVVDGVSRSGSKVKHWITFEVIDGGFGRHEAKDHAELGGVWTPGHIVDGTLLG